MQIKKHIVLAVFVAFIGIGAFAHTYSGKVCKNHMIIETLIGKGQYNEALKKVNSILGENPNDLNARAYLGSIYSIQYKLGAATEEYKKILEKDKKNAAAHNGLGMVYYRRTASSDMEYRRQIPELLNKALSEFNLAIKYAPTYYQAYNNAGIILLELGRIPEAENYFTKAIELKPDYSEAVENVGRVLFAKNKSDEAIKKYEKSISINSRNSSAYYHLGEALIAREEYSEAIKQLQTSLYLFPNSAPVHNMLGKAYEMQGNEVAAIAEYKKAAMIKPEFAAPYLSLAEIYKNRGDDEFAMVELRNAIAINPDFHEAKAKLAEIALNIGKTNHTIKYYKELLEVPEYKDRALKGLARAYFLKADASHFGDIVQVESNLRQALSYDPENLELYLALLRVSRISKKSDKTDYYLEKILETSRDNKVSYIIKGEAFLTVHEYGSAEREFVKAINQTNTDDDLLELAEIFIINRVYSPAQIAINRVLTKNRENLRAKRLFERIICNKDHAVSKMKVAEGFYDEKQYNAAIEAYKDAISLDPYLMEAHKSIAGVYEKIKNYNRSVEHYKAYITLVDAGRNVRKYQRKIEKLERKLQDNKD